MKIAIVHYSAPPVIGGVETIVAEHARLFAEHGHEVRILCQRGAGGNPRVRVEVVADAETLSSRLAEMDVVFLHNVLTMPFDAAWTAALWEFAERHPAVRCIAWIHDLAARNPDYTVAPADLIALACPHFEYVAISEHRRRQFETLTGTTATVIPNAIDPARSLGLSGNITSIAEPHRLLARDIVLLHPARLLQRKNVELSLRVLAALRSRGCDACLLVTGPPDSHHPASAAYAEELRALRDDLALAADAIFLHDFFAVFEADMRGLFAISDALFFPSKQEGFGLPILEAALHRLPIFCANIEPLTSLAGGAAHSFPLDAEPSEIAAQIADTLALSPEWRARKAVTRDSSWSAIYDKFLAPLLTPTAS